MNATATYFTAAVPEPVRVLGLELKPFCLGHCITLNRFGSAFVDESAREASKGEVIFAAVVCHFTFDEFYQFIRQEDFGSQLEKLGRDIGIFSIREKAKLLQDYVQEASKMPAYVMEQDESRSGAHWTHTVLAAAVSHCGYTRTEALNAPLQQVLWDFLKHAESNGVVSLISKAELDAINALN